MSQDPCRAQRTLSSPVGPLTLQATDDGLCLLHFGSLPPLSASAPLHRAEEHLHCAVQELQAYFGGTLRSFTVPLDLRGTPFRLQVWKALQAIPYGETRSYGQLAQMVGCPRGPRAVGGAAGANPVAVIVPCHRLLAAGGRLGGFSGGLAIKEALLLHEKKYFSSRGGDGQKKILPADQ